MKKVFFLVIVGLFVFCSPVYASTVTYTVILNDGYAEGITDLTIGDLGTFDVAFIWGTFFDVYSANDIVFQNEADGLAASNAVNDALNSVNAWTLREAGTTTETAQDFSITYDFSLSKYWFIYNYPENLSGDFPGWTTNISPLFAVDATVMHAIFTPVQSTVPVPGAVWLLGSGLMGLIGLRRKFGK